MLTYLLSLTILLAVSISTVLITAEKTGALEYIRSKVSNKFIIELTQCFFCMSFWLAVICAFIITIATGNIYCMVILPLGVPSIVRFII